MFHLTPVVVAMVNASLVDEVDEPFSTYTVMFNIYLHNISDYFFVIVIDLNLKVTHET